MTPRGARGEAAIERDHCRFEVEYSPTCFRGIWGAEPPPLQWQCRQSWRLDAQSLRGAIRMTSSARQCSPPPIVRIRFGENDDLRETNEGRFRYGPFALTILRSDFPHRAIAAAPSCPCYTEKKTRELLLRVRNSHAPADVPGGQAFELELEVRFEGGQGGHER